jgi:hypothetical protein
VPVAEWNFPYQPRPSPEVHRPRPTGIRLRAIASTLDITERTAYGIVTHLTEGGYVVKESAAGATATRSRPSTSGRTRHPRANDR